MSKETIIKNNMLLLKKEMEMIINYKEKILFFALDKKYVLEDLENMEINTNKIILNLKGVVKSFIIDKKFFLILKQLKILIIEQRDLEKIFKENPTLIDNILKIKDNLNDKNLYKNTEKITIKELNDVIEKEIEKNMGDKEINLNYRYKEYTFD